MQAAAFDQYANDYDSHFTNSVIGVAQRNRVKAFTQKYFTKSSSVLEINCGSGEDALWIATKVKNIIATDASIEMIKVAKNKTQHSANNNLQFIKGDFNKLETIFLTDRFDIIFSNFAGLNCVSETELKKLSNHFSNLLNEQGKLLLVLMGTKCWLEKLYFMYKGETAKSKRRTQKSGVPTQIENASFLTFYYSPDQIKALFKPEFIVKEIKPIGYFIPPSYLESFIAKKPLLAKLLFSLEKRVAHFSWMANRADHYFICLEKK